MLRRKFLKLSGLGALVVAAPTAGFASISLKDATVGSIINEFDYLQLDKKGVEQFVDDFLAYNFWNGSFKHTLVMRAIYTTKTKSDRSVSLFKTNMLKTLADTYLLSTDFFSNNMDENKPLKYMGLYSPHLKPCANPFSFIHYPAVVS
ncbi:hypothetical protein [Pontibacter harenae]|uniref:hypothetical protein n=1 Tax=Pontibacter harenae TaxID=2894083 RepID=UPI001E61AB56|nr:hypothetical protein [Pontibacter harenae]MCC9165619.1 hypothetical protein [Pontibacter harenae]